MGSHHSPSEEKHHQPQQTDFLFESLKDKYKKAAQSLYEEEEEEDNPPPPPPSTIPPPLTHSGGGGGERHLETCCQREILRYRALYEEILSERNQFKAQCTQAIKQWDSALRERNEFKEALSLAQRKQDEALKEVNQVISVKLKASKDLKRLTEERNAAMQEYSLIMSERDSVHKEIERLQEEISCLKKRASLAESQYKDQEVDRRKMYCHIEILKREIENSLQERDKALKEVQDLREKVGLSTGLAGCSGGGSHGRGGPFVGPHPPIEDTYYYLKNCKNFIDKMDSDRPKRNVNASLQSEDDLSKGNGDGSGKASCETLEQAHSEISRLLKLQEKLQMNLHDAKIEADIDKGRRDLAFSERDKILLEREAMRTLCDKLRHERDRADSELVEMSRETSEMKLLNRRLSSENAKLRSRIDEFKSNPPQAYSSSPGGGEDLRPLSPPHSASSCAWETRTLDIELKEDENRLSGWSCKEDSLGAFPLGLDLVEERDSLGSTLPRVASLRPNSLLSGRILENDYILSINDLSLRGLSLRRVRELLGGSGPISLRLSRLQSGKESSRKVMESRVCSTVFDIKNNQSLGLSLETGVFVSRVEEGSLAHGRLFPGDRLLSLDDMALPVGNNAKGFTLRDVLAYLSVPRNSLRVSYVKAMRGDGELGSTSPRGESTPPAYSTSRGVPKDPKKQKRSGLKRKEAAVLFGGTWPRSQGPRGPPTPPKGPSKDLQPPGGGDKKPIHVSSSHPKETSSRISTLKSCPPPIRPLTASAASPGDPSVTSAHEDAHLLRYLRRQPKETPPKRNNTALIHNLLSVGGGGGHLEVPPGSSPRIRIPSNTSVTSNSSASKRSSSSMDNKSFQKMSGVSLCSSSSPPLPFYSIQYLSGDGRISELLHYSRKSLSGEIRQIFIQKSSEQLGFTIDEGALKGVFVSSVNDNSLAMLVGLQVGDQLLEVCGINLRSCGKEQASRVLHQVGSSITLKVQYNPEDFSSYLHSICPSESPSESPSSGGGGSSRASSSSSLSERSSYSQGSPCCGRVKGGGHVNEEEGLFTDEMEDEDLFQEEEEEEEGSLFEGPKRPGQPPPPPSYAECLGRGLTSASPPYEPRLVLPEACAGDLGVRLVGGNAVGIFIHSVEPGSPACRAGLRSSDQILEVDSVDLRSSTAEQAAYELAKPGERSSTQQGLLVQYNPDMYTAIKDAPGDSLYVRATFERAPLGPQELGFAKDDILYVDNTMYNGVPGHWSAWSLDAEGRKLAWGIIPSKYKVEEELLTRKSLGNLDVERRGGWTSTRRSFFKRKKSSGSGGSRCGSVPKELASYMDIGSLSDSGNLQEEPGIHSYIRVERFDGQVPRPVLLLGPFSELISEKLVLDYPEKFSRLETRILEGDPDSLESALRLDSSLIELKRRSLRSFEVTSLSSLKGGRGGDPGSSSSSTHVILSMGSGGPEALERLHAVAVYPIVILIKFKSLKQIREMRDSRLIASGNGKMTAKDAKNIFELTAKMESEHRDLISAVVHAGANLMLICTQIVSQIDREQEKTLWVPLGSIW